MNFPFFLARKLSTGNESNSFSPAMTVAIAAVAISLTVMMASVAIVNGFKKEIRDKVVGFNGHITLYTVPLSQDDDNLILLSPSLKEELNSVPFIKEYSLQAALPAVMKTANDFKGVYLKGLNGDANVKFLEKNLEEGEVVDFNNEENKEKIIISNIAARQLGLKTGDKIDTYFFSDDIRVRRLEVAGIFNSHFDRFDDVMIYGPLSLVQKLGSIEASEGTFVQIFTDNFDKIDAYTLSLQGILNEATADGRVFRAYRTDNVLRQSAGYFNWLALLDTNVVVILILMTVVGAVTLVSGMLIIILEKKRFIGLMKSLGAKTGSIRQIFIYLALRITLVGLFFGNLIALGILYTQRATHFIPLDADSYYIDFVPVEISWLDIVLLNAGVIIVAYIVLVLPSKFVAGITPSETMRYE